MVSVKQSYRETQQEEKKKRIYVPLSVNTDDDKANRENCISFSRYGHLHILNNAHTHTHKLKKRTEPNSF